MNLLKKFFISFIVFILAIPAFSYSKKELINAVTANSPILVNKILDRNPELVKLRFDNEQNTILIVALQNKCNYQIIDKIINAGCSVNATNKSKQTALMIAAKTYDKKTVNRILSSGVMGRGAKISRLSQKDSNGDTAFDFASGNQKIYDFFSSFTVDPKIAKQKEEERLAQIQAEEENLAEDVSKTEENVQPEQEPTQTQLEQTEETQIAEQTQQLENPSEEVTKIEESVSDENLFEQEVAKVEDSKTEVEFSENLFEEGKNKIDATSTESNTTVEEVAVEAVVPEVAIATTDSETSENQESKETEVTEKIKESEQLQQPVVVEVTEKIEEPSTQIATVIEVPEVPQIDYSTKDRVEYLFDEVDYDSKIKSELGEKDAATSVIIKNPDAFDKNGRTKLMNAIIKNDLKLCYDLLNSGANINLSDDQGWTPLMYACKYSKSTNIIYLLLSFNASINAKTLSKLSTLQIAAAFTKNPEIIKALLLETKKLENQTITVKTAFITALKQEQNAEIIKEFLPYLQNLNFFYKGKTPLMIASSYYKTTSVIKLLLENGANPAIISSEKKTAFMYAKENEKIVRDDIFWSLNVSTKNN